MTYFEPNSLLLFGAVLLGGFFAGEASRRLLDLPRTTGYVLFGLAGGASGLGWIDPYIIESARFFIDVGLGLILFELGHSIPNPFAAGRRPILFAGLAESLLTLALITGSLLMLGFSPASALFAAIIGVSTSPAITIATTSDVGARGARTDTLLTLVAINGAVAFCGVSLLSPLLDTAAGTPLQVFAAAALKIVFSLALGAMLAAIVTAGARWLGHHAEHQHLLILGLIVIGVGIATSLDTSALLALLSFGVISRALDRGRRVAAIRIASDARVFLVVTFVLAGAALEAGLLTETWLAAAVFVLARFGAKLLAMNVMRRALSLDRREAVYAGVGLLPMSSVALVLLDEGAPYAGLDQAMVSTLLAAVFLMQVFGPVATQVSIRGFGETSAQRSGDKGKE